ncbi:Meiosis regulator and mRNA stability factor 1 [Araneus ventricosus]|uniref:Meiosis regulator and mRNA stability factor 1 n=1 Tax=Araneus ventricosus TaxID=182803 RepID=A0A4Y2D0Q7_ARAVE|nr:Meiosis regulator and mRNA stability factor 1 [Araneus ventricosus]
MAKSADLALNKDTIPENTPIGVFWDFENVRVPRRKSAFDVVQAIRARFYANHHEANFTVVCDTFKESREILDDLNAAQVDIIYTRATAKNSIDEKLKQCMRRFVRTNKSPSTLILLTGDANFVTDVSDFRHRDLIEVTMSIITDNLPLRRAIKDQPVQVCVTALPQELSTDTTAAILLKLSDNCGGHLESINADEAILVFGSAECATRARIRLNDGIVGSSQIKATLISSDRPNSPRPGTSNEPNTPQRNNDSSTDETEPQIKALPRHNIHFDGRKQRNELISVDQINSA